MTETAAPADLGSKPTGRHPLDPVSAEEYLAGRRILEAAGLLGHSVRFSYYGLEEEPKGSVAGYPAGEPCVRRLRALLIDVVTGAQTVVVVSVSQGAVLSKRTVDPVTEGQFPILSQDFARADEIVHADPGWRAALAQRGLTDLDKVRGAALTAGSYDRPGEAGRRIVRVLAFVQESPTDLAWAHPVDGVAAYVDLVEGRVLEIIDEIDLPVPAESGDYNDPRVRGPQRSTLRPIEITQPEGPSFTIEGHYLTWEHWSLRVGFDAREGLTLHEIAFDDPAAGRRRPVIYRASIAEMVVPYGDPSPVRYWQNYFDTGEYLLGKFVNSLELGCDCLGQIAYLDAIIPDDHGQPRTVPNAVCIHEEDVGVLWKHTDSFNGSSESRRQRRLVISFFTTVGNYDYGFYWYFSLDGTIELEVKLTGVLFASSYRGDDWPYATEVAPGLGAPVHQHLFSARLDMTVDGERNAVDEIDVVPVAPSEANPAGNAITRQVTRLRRESEAARLACSERDRAWRVVSTERNNRYGKPTAFTLRPRQGPTLLADPSSSLYRRATFATRHLWVTRYDPAERYPAGEFVNQHPGGAGLPVFVDGDDDIDGADLVVWHTFGPTHWPRPEDWPIMPVSRCGFTLEPTGFFDRNPTLDVPPPGASGG